jgi:hypothetical protein
MVTVCKELLQEEIVDRIAIAVAIAACFEDVRIRERCGFQSRKGIKGFRWPVQQH